MSITTNTIIDKIEVLETGLIQVRQATVVLQDDKEIARNFERWVLNPGDDISTQDPKVQAIANATWTPEVIAAYKQQLAIQQTAMPKVTI